MRLFTHSPPVMSPESSDIEQGLLEYLTFFFLILILFYFISL